MNRVLKTLVIGLPLIGVFYGIYFGYFPNAPDIHRKEDIIGTWATNGSYSYNEQGIKVSTKVKTSYFSNGKYNVSGEMSYSSDKINNTNLFVSYRVNGAGEWQINDKELVISLNNMKSTPNKIIYNGEEVDLQNLSLVEKFTNKRFPAVEDMMADGASQSYQIIIDNHNYKKLHVINPFGNNFNMEMYREK
ncbi:hypothetical protein [Klebsiella oxytoca]|uniref:hypothetical protein n=1 Tax=Klebsiella oxytoca TaxID=571 RepID=UPI00287D088B|nr:hypothetical protein [Klebsiella oxytoca]MDS7881822.1 hypothetical protein [Klebsiella oxytoca]